MLGMRSTVKVLASVISRKVKNDIGKEEEIDIYLAKSYEELQDSVDKY